MSEGARSPLEPAVKPSHQVAARQRADDRREHLILSLQIERELAVFQRRLDVCVGVSRAQVRRRERRRRWMRSRRQQGGAKRATAPPGMGRDVAVLELRRRAAAAVVNCVLKNRPPERQRFFAPVARASRVNSSTRHSPRRRCADDAISRSAASSPASCRDDGARNLP